MQSSLRLVSIFSLLLFSLQIYAFGEDSLTPSTYQTEVLDSNVPHLIVYESNEDETNPQHEMVSAMVEDLKSRLNQYDILIRRFDCGLKKHKRFCGKVGLRTIPALQLVQGEPTINPYSNKNIRDTLLYDGPPGDAKTIERKFISKNFYMDKVIAVNSVDGLKEVISSNKLELILFSNKEAVSLLFRSICAAFSQELSCTQSYSMSLEEVNENFFSSSDKQVVSLPSVALLANGELKLYPSSTSGIGASDRSDLLSFISSEIKVKPYTSKAGLSEEEEEGGGDESGVNRQKKSNVDRHPQIEAKHFDGVTGIDKEASYVILVRNRDKELTEEDVTRWKKVSNACEGAVRPMSLLCSDSSEGDKSFGEKLCEEKRSIPFLYILPYISAQDDDRGKYVKFPLPKQNVLTMEEYTKSKSLALQSLPDNRVPLLSEMVMEPFIASGLTSNRLSVLILSDKESPSATIKNVAVTLTDYANVAFISQPSDGFIRNLGIPAATTLPAMIALHPMPEDDKEGGHALVLYDVAAFGPMKFNSMMNFVMSVYAQSGMQPDASSDVEGGNTRSDTAGYQEGGMYTVPADSPREVTTEEEWNESCSRGICLLMLVPPKEMGGESALYNGVEKALISVGKSAEAFKVIKINGYCQLSLSARFDVPIEALPGLVVYSPSRSRYVTYSNNLGDIRNIAEFLKKSLKGEMSTTSIAQRPQFESKCEFTGEDYAVSVEEEEIEMDFLEEIRREEAEKQASLKREVIEEEKQRKEDAEKAKAEANKPKKIIRKVKKKKKKNTEL